MPTWNNPNPLANPLNSGGITAGQKGINRRCLKVPNQDIPFNGSPEWHDMFNKQRELTVPNQDIPPGDQTNRIGFISQTSEWFQLGDGTRVNFRTNEILIPKQNNSDELRWIDPPYASVSPDWSPPESIESVLSKFENSKRQTENTDRISIKYWIRAKIEAEKLRNEMTDEQREMLDMFEHHFPKSKFIDDSKDGT